MDVTYCPREAVQRAVAARLAVDPSYRGVPMCPTCDAPEMHPAGGVLLVRAFKVVDEYGVDWSHCLVCASAFEETVGGYDANLVWHSSGQGRGMSAVGYKTGWFCDDSEPASIEVVE